MNIYVSILGPFVSASGREGKSHAKMMMTTRTRPIQALLLFLRASADIGHPLQEKEDNGHSAPLLPLQGKGEGFTKISW